jgi:glycosyltransferase involved in cell wall biosynthesis
MGGGMFRVAEYLIQNQKLATQHAQLLPLDTRGGGSALGSLWVLMQALGHLVSGRISGRLAGVHVNMAERLSLFRKGAMIVVARLLGIPVVLHLHAAQLHHFYRKLPAPLQALTRGIFALSSHCIVLGNAAREFVTEELRVPPNKVQVVNNGVPAPTATRRIQSNGRPRRVLFLGNLSERKGVSDFLHALATPGLDWNIQVSLAGGGDIERYQALAEELGITGFVRFEGWADQTKAAALMASADVLILPSYDEGLPLVILEALAHGVAVICTPVGEIPFALQHGTSAIFVTPGDVPGIATALHQVLNDDLLRKRLEQNGRMLYEAKFSMGQFFSNIAAIHRRVFGISAAPMITLQALSSEPAVPSRPAAISRS